MEAGRTDPVRTLPKCLFYDVIGVVAFFQSIPFPSYLESTFFQRLYDGRLRLFVTLSLSIITLMIIIVNQHTYTAHTDNENYLSRALERLGTTALSKDQETEIGAAFIKFSVVTKELSALLRTLVYF